jgi:hypothetical protein
VTRIDVVEKLKEEGEEFLAVLDDRTFHSSLQRVPPDEGRSIAAARADYHETPSAAAC